MKKNKLLLATAALMLGGSVWAQTTWTDKTSVITNPSFETDNAVSDATKNALNSASVTGWTILPTTTVSNAQAATVNSSSTLSVLNGSDGATTGSKYFYVRQNWNETGNFGIQQVIAAGQPAGLYLLTCKIKTSSSSPDKTKWYLSIKEGDKDAIINEKAGSAAEWLNNGVVLYKESSETTLTISAYFVAGASGSSQHYAMLLDDFELKYVSPTDMGSITASSTLDLSGVIYNAGIYNANKTVLPRGWIAYADTRGNSNYTEGTGDTQLEGWSGSNMNIDYYQGLSNLPVGKYTVTARAHDSNDQGAVVYGWSDGVGTTGGDMGVDYADVTTDALAVTNGIMNIGIKHNGGASWVTGDNFRVTYLGIQPLYDEALAAATSARDNIDYTNVKGKELKGLTDAIALAPSTYEDYQSAITALQNATATFTAAKDTWDACVTEYTHYTELSGSAEYTTFYSSTTTGQDVLNAIKTAEYTAVTTKYDTDGSALFITEWTVTNFDSQNAQHWSAESRTYYDKWSGSAFNCSISKTVTLPEGHYAFYAAGRGQANSASAVTLKVAISGGSPLTQTYTMKGDTGYGINTSGAADFTAAGEGHTYANNNNGRGWEWRYIVFDLNAETEVTLSIEGTGSNSWVSACDTKLLTYENVEVSRRLYTANKTTAETARDASEYTNVQGAERAALIAAINDDSFTKDYAGYRDAAVALENATNAFIAAKTNWDALVREIGKATALGASTTTAEAARDNAATTSAGALAATQALKVVEYNYVTDTYEYGVDLGIWTTTGSTGSLSSQHWSGETREYLEQSSANWAASSWTIKYDQNVTLPAGNYVFKVAGRQADSDGVTLSLTVKDGETVLGSVSDFPRGDRGLGITTAGATSFDSNDTFCNTRNNNGDNLQTNGGNGWEWRYVKFTLASDATVNVAVNAEATTSHMWVSFCDATVQTNNEAIISLIAYNIALGSARTTIANDDYTNVTGDEKTALQAAIDADSSLDKTNNAAIVAATTALDNAREAFVAAKDAYNAFVAAKAVTYEDNLPYASATKFAAIGTAQAADDATSATDATTKTNAILSAYRKYVESNAMAEGVTDAESITIPDYRFAGMSSSDIDTENWKIGDNWILDGQNNGTISLTNSGSFTDGDGNANYNYIHIQKNDNNAGIHQTINLEPGHYMMTVTARCQSGMGAKFEAFAGGVYVNVPQNDNVGGQFDRGWNDVSVEFSVAVKDDISFGVKSDWGKNIWWSATRFRLVKLQESVTVTDAGYATYASDNALDFTHSDIKAYIAIANGTTGVTFTKIDKVPANTGVLLHYAGGKTEDIPVFDGTGAESTDGNVFVRGTGAAVASVVETTKHNYILNNGASGIGFYKAADQTVATNRAYIQINEGAGIKEFISLDLEDAPDGISATLNDKGQMINDNIYNVAGQRIDNSQFTIHNSQLKRGIYIVNGKKILK